MEEQTALYMMHKYQAFHMKCSVCQKFAYVQMEKLHNSEGDVVNFFRHEKDGRALTLEAIRHAYACCNKLMHLRLVEGTYDKSVDCGASCFRSRSKRCTCSCGGILHGVDYAGYLTEPKLKV